MKIKISDSESYQLELPEEMPLEDFIKIVKKLNAVVEFVTGKSTSAKQINSVGRPVVPKPKRTREEIIEVLKIFYTYSKETIKEALKVHNLTWTTVNLTKYKWIETYKITSSDLGIEIPDNRIPNKAVEQ